MPAPEGPVERVPKKVFESPLRARRVRRLQRAGALGAAALSLVAALGVAGDGPGVDVITGPVREALQRVPGVSDATPEKRSARGAARPATTSADAREKARAGGTGSLTASRGSTPTTQPGATTTTSPTTTSTATSTTQPPSDTTSTTSSSSTTSPTTTETTGGRPSTSTTRRSRQGGGPPTSKP